MTSFLQQKPHHSFYENQSELYAAVRFIFSFKYS